MATQTDIISEESPLITAENSPGLQILPMKRFPLSTSVPMRNLGIRSRVQDFKIEMFNSGDEVILKTPNKQRPTLQD